MAAKADLHIHSTASDGLMQPAEVVDAAKELHLKTIALTDHDTIDGIQPARKAAADAGIKVMSGVEITTAFEKGEVHMLAYDFDLEDETLKKYLNDHKKARVKRAKEIINSLQKKGLQVTINEVMAESKAQNVCRPHIAAVLFSKGYVATLKEAFIRYLSDEALGVIKNFYHSLHEVVAMVRGAGGVAVIAHPGRLYSEGQLKKFVEAGIDGIEITHPSHSFEIQKNLEQFAKKYDLLTTGGSDFHGKTKKYYRHFGTLGITEKDVKKIEGLALHRKEVPA